MENDTDTSGGEELATSLTMDEAVAAYAKTLTSNEADTGQSEDIEDEEQGDTTDDELQASDEGEGEETDGNDDENAGQAEDDESDEEPDSDQGRFVASNGKVRLPDGTVSTVADLVQGNLRDRDYRQKTMELAELRKSSEAQSSAYEASKKQFDERATYMEALLKSIVPAAPDPGLAQTDPYRFMTEKANHDAWVAHLQTIQQGIQQSSQETAEQAETKRREKLDEEYKALVAAVPELKDQARFNRFEQDVFKFGAEYGFSHDDLRGVAMDHRQVLVLRDAIAFRKLQASKPKVQAKVEGKPPVIKGGKRLNPADHKVRHASDAMNRLKQSGSVEDAAAAYIASLNKG